MGTYTYVYPSLALKSTSAGTATFILPNGTIYTQAITDYASYSLNSGTVRPTNALSMWATLGVRMQVSVAGHGVLNSAGVCVGLVMSPKIPIFYIPQPLPPYKPGAAPPGVNSILATYHNSVKTTSVGVSPTGTFYDFVPTCAWINNPPAAALTAQYKTFDLPLPSPPGRPWAQPWVMWTVGISPQSTIQWNYGDGTGSNGNFGSPGHPVSGGGGNCSNPHVYKTTSSGGYTISATQQFGLIVRWTYFDGQNTTSGTLLNTSATLTYIASGPHPVYQIEGISNG